MYGKIHHLGIAVRSLADTVKLYRDTLGFDYEKELDWSELGLRAAIFNIGQTKLEFIEPVEPKGEIAQSVTEYTKVKDGMVHHVAFTVDNVVDEIARLKSKGVRMLTEEPVRSDGGMVAWLDQKTVDGFMIELCDSNYEIL